MQLFKLLTGALAAGAAALVSAKPLPERAGQTAADTYVARELGAQAGGLVWDGMLEARDLASAPAPELQSLAERIVFNPHITYPTAKTVWTAGETHHVKWKTDNIPEQLKDATSMLKLGFEPKNGAGGLNERWTLAKGFPLTAGQVEFTLPTTLETRHDYIVVLFGDSGNASPHFTIKALKPKTTAPAQQQGQPAAPPQQQSSVIDTVGQLIADTL